MIYLNYPQPNICVVNICHAMFFTCVLCSSKSNLFHIPYFSTVQCFSGYSCRLVTHGMSLIIVNEDSLDVSRPSSSSWHLLQSHWCMLYRVPGLSVHVFTWGKEGMWWVFKQATVRPRVWSTIRLVGGALCVFTGADN